MAQTPTERRNPRTRELDQLPTLEVLKLINAEDKLVPLAVAAALPDLANAVDLAVAALANGARVHYVGAGSSGRMAVLDAAELPPTFGIPADWFHTHLAGGPVALTTAVENAEDDQSAGAETMQKHVSAQDFVLGLSASGHTPFVLAALAAAREIGAQTALLTANTELAATIEVDVMLVCDTGPEALTGSTRMKAGSAEKLILTSFSTAVMVRLGRTYSNLMVSLRATNTKLRNRSLTILCEATGFDEQRCLTALAQAHGEVQVALLCLLTNVDSELASKKLNEHQGNISLALHSLKFQQK